MLWFRVLGTFVHRGATVPALTSGSSYVMRIEILLHVRVVGKNRQHAVRHDDRPRTKAEETISCDACLVKSCFI